MSTVPTFNTTGKALLPVEEVAEMMGLHPNTIRRYIDKKLIAVCKPGGKKGRVFIRPADLDAFLLRTRRSAIGE